MSDRSKKSPSAFKLGGYERRKKPNAYKHGIFLRSAMVLPGEDEQEYRQLVEAHIKEWAVDGESELEAVLTMVDAKWRIMRAQRYRQARLTKNRHDIKHPSFDEHLCLGHFVTLIAGAPESFDGYAAQMLHPGRIEYLKQRFPRQNFASTEDWIQAITKEINLELDPSSRFSGPLRAVAESLMATIDKSVLTKLAAQTFTDDVLEQELAIDERLYAMYDKGLKRLIHIKAMKQMLGLARPAGTVDQPARNVAAKISD